MTALGSITHFYTPPVTRPLPWYPVTDYDINIGRFLGPVTVVDVEVFEPILEPASLYIVRQLIVVFRQLWPTHGQRFPQ